MLNRKWILESPYYVHHKKHYCPVCNEQLLVRRIKKIVNSKSPEANDFDFTFSGGGGFLFGNVEFSYEAFYCKNCDREISIKEMKLIEKGPPKHKHKALPRMIKLLLFHVIGIALLILFLQLRTCLGQTENSRENNNPLSTTSKSTDLPLGASGENYSIQTATGSSEHKNISVHIEYSEGLLYVYLKKHFCPECGTRLATAYDSFVIDIDSPKAKEYGFSKEISLGMDLLKCAHIISSVLIVDLRFRLMK